MFQPNWLSWLLATCTADHPGSPAEDLLFLSRVPLVGVLVISEGSFQVPSLTKSFLIITPARQHFSFLRSVTTLWAFLTTYSIGLSFIHTHHDMNTYKRVHLLSLIINSHTIKPNDIWASCLFHIHKPLPKRKGAYSPWLLSSGFNNNCIYLASFSLHVLWSRRCYRGLV